MSNLYKKFLNNVLSIDKTLKNAQSEPFFKRDYKKYSLPSQKINTEAVEEYKNLKENITEISLSNQNLAYQHIEVKSGND